MFTALTLDLALLLHQERIAEAERWRQATMVRRAGREAKTRQARSLLPSTTRPEIRFGRPVDLADWLVRVGDIVVQYPMADLHGDRRAALAVVIKGLLEAAREGGADVSLDVNADDAAVALLRALGRVAASTAGGSYAVSRRRARMLRTALDNLVQGPVAEETRTRGNRAA